MDDQVPLTDIFTTNCSLNSNDDDGNIINGNSSSSVEASNIDLLLSNIFATDFLLNADGDEDNIISGNSSSSVVASNIDLLIEILVCLPGKSLLLFKLVSKQWLSLISDSSFIRKHAIRNISHPITGVFLNNPKDREIGFLYQPIKQEGFLFLGESNINVNVPHVINSRPLLNIIESQVHILQSCNGLILCSSYHNTPRRIHIFNPTTGCNKILPPPPSIKLCSTAHLNCNFSLAFDPIKSPYYEVIHVHVTVSEDRIFHQHHIEIYSSKTDSWRVSGEHVVDVLCPCSPSGVFWNGSLHWVPSDDESKLLVYLNIDQGLLKTMPMPPVPDGNSKEIEYFGESQGNLYVIKGDRNKEFDIFELEIDYSGWNKRYHFNLDWLTTGFFSVFGKRRLELKLLFIEETEQDSFKLVLNQMVWLTADSFKSMPNMYISCDLKDLRFVSWSVMPASFRSHGSFQREEVSAYRFIDSLASV